MANKANKLAFLSQPAPASYVAGLGRGASGFTTRSDIGPAREGPSAEAVAYGIIFFAHQKVVANVDISEAQARRGEESEVDPEQFQDPDNEMGLFAGMTYEADDEEADRIYEQVDKNMDARRRARRCVLLVSLLSFDREPSNVTLLLGYREAREQEELAKHRAERPKIQQQFADLKRGLSVVTDEEWENLPEVGNLTRRKRKRDERTFVVPDSVLVGDRAKNEYENSLDPMQQEVRFHYVNGSSCTNSCSQSGGLVTPADSGTLTNFVEIGQARDKILSLKLDQISGTATSGTSTSIDPKGYLTDLASVVHKTEAEIGDIKRARMLFDSLVKSNPKHAPGWIAAACVEEHAGRMVAARKLIKAGCEHCPKSEDVWLEAARLHNPADAKVILANAVQHVPQSVKIWLKAASLEQDSKSKKRVLRKALEQIPNSVRLWKETVNLEESITDARILLARAVEVIPLSVELWLALARLEAPDKAKAVLNKARKAIPTSHEIWIAAGRLLEQEAESPDKPEAERKKTLETVDRTIEAGVRELRRHQVLLTREQWLKEAERCETEGSPRTCEAIIKATVGMEVEEEDRLDTWVGDAESAEERGKIGSARAILAYALKVFPDRRMLWEKAAALEKIHGTRYVRSLPDQSLSSKSIFRESLDAVLERAVHHCPQAEDLWLMSAKEKWLADDVPGARQVLERAFSSNPDSEKIWLAAVKLEAENGEFGVARTLLGRARTVADTQRVSSIS